MPSLYEFEAPSITGEPIRLSQFEGQLCLVVNVASR
jgi:glutathione peroxidase